MATNQQMAFIKIIYYFSILSNYINNYKKIIKSIIVNVTS